MILAHWIVGAAPIDGGTFCSAWFLGSVLPDLDHLYVFWKHRIFGISAMIETLRHEDEYEMRYKTEWMHSVLGAAFSSLLFWIFAPEAAGLFFAGYLLHLVLDWPDQDEKHYLFPLKLKFRGFLPIFSKAEIAFTILLAAWVLALYS